MAAWVQQPRKRKRATGSSLVDQLVEDMGLGDPALRLGARAALFQPPVLLHLFTRAREGQIVVCRCGWVGGWRVGCVRLSVSLQWLCVV